MRSRLSFTIRLAGVAGLLLACAADNGSGAGSEGERPNARAGAPAERPAAAAAPGAARGGALPPGATQAAPAGR